MGMTGIPQNPWEISGNGYSCCGNTAGMELRLAGIRRVWNLLLREIRRCVLENVQSYVFRPTVFAKIIFTSWTDLRWPPLSTVCWLCGWTVVFAWTQVVIPTTVHLLLLRVIHVLLECYYCNIVTQRYFSVTTLKKLIETVGANSIIAIIKDISFYHPIYAGGDGNRSVRGRVGMDPSTCGSGCGWIQTTRERVGMGLKSCPRAYLYCRQLRPSRPTRGMGLLYSGNCKILTSTVFAWITCVTDGRTDGRTELR